MLKIPGILAILITAALPPLIPSALADADGRKYKMLVAPIIVDVQKPASAGTSLNSLNSLGSIDGLLGGRGGLAPPPSPSGGVNAGMSDGSVRFLKSTTEMSAARPTTDAGASSGTPGVTGRITGVAVDPNNPNRPFNGIVNRISQGTVDRRDSPGNTVYTGGAGSGVWKSMDGGKTVTAPSVMTTRK
jgi:hypothetical protein